VVDRSTIRVSAEVPEGDFEVVTPGTPVKLHLLATSAETAGTIARRSPAANGATRTVHLEIDLSDPQRQIPVGTTAELAIKVGKPEPASVIALSAASVRESSATVFIIEGNQAKKVVVPVKGESLGALFVDTALKPGTRIVTEGRSLLADGDAVAATTIAPDSHVLVAEGKEKP
jgi:multidrug efflux pump subunit AcrA (membrane-fusion protein)